jgi:hypothetical protein
VSGCDSTQRTLAPLMARAIQVSRVSVIIEK